MHILLASLGAGSMLFLSLFIRRNTLLGIIGRHNLVVYTIHPIFAHFLLNRGQGFVNHDSMIASVSFFVVVFMGTILLSVLVAYLLNTKYLRFLTGRF